MNAPVRFPALGEVAIAAEGVSKTFGTRRVLDDVSLTVAEGDTLAIVGESGCGKSTLLRLFAGLDVPDDGRIEVAGERFIAFQDARLLPWLHVIDNVAFGLPGLRAAARASALQALEEVGLGRLADAWPNTLSGGEAQRVALARAIVRNPRVLFLDEPFGALDALTRLRMHTLLRKLWDHHRFTVVLVTHDVDEALSLADQVVVLGSGVVLDRFEVPLPHPRSRLDRQFGQLRERLLDQLGVPVA